MAIEEYDDENEESLDGDECDVRKIGYNKSRFVTEEKLERRLDVFSKEIKQDFNRTKDEIKVEISKLATVFRNSGQGNKNGYSGSKFSNVTCYNCNQEGHISRYCPVKNSSNYSAGHGSSGDGQDEGQIQLND